MQETGILTISNLRETGIYTVLNLRENKRKNKRTMQLPTHTLLQGGKYRIERVLGQGGFGITYLATQVALGRKVAIKEFFMKEYCERDGSTSHVSLGTSGSRETVERFRTKFIKEAQTIAEMDNNHIIRIYDVFEENGTAYYVMEHLPGGDLSKRIPNNGLPETEALEYVRQIGNALTYIHAKNILHLDVKPTNILFRENGEVVLIDFGVSKHYDDTNGSQTSSTPVGISEGYAPTEQYDQEAIASFAPSTDVYSLGATLFCLLCGTRPPKASVVLNEGLPALPSNVSDSTRKGVERAMAPRRKDRPQSVKEFLALLDDEVTIITPKTEPKKTPKATIHPTSKSFKRRIVFLMVCIVSILAVIILWPNKDGILTNEQTPIIGVDSVSNAEDSTLLTEAQTDIRKEEQVSHPSKSELVNNDDEIKTTAAEENKTIVPVWFENIMNQGEWIGISPPMKDKKKAKNVAVLNAVLYYLCNNEEGDLKSIYTADRKSINETDSLQFEEAIQLSLNKFTISNCREFRNYLGEYYVACKIDIDEKSKNWIQVTRTSSEIGNKGNLKFDVTAKIDGKDYAYVYNLGYDMNKISSSIIVDGVSWEEHGISYYPDMKFSKKNYWGFRMPLKNSLGMTQIQCLATSPFVAHELNVQSISDMTETNMSGIVETKFLQVMNILGTGKKKAFRILFNGIENNELEISVVPSKVPAGFVEEKGFYEPHDYRPLLTTKSLSFYLTLASLSHNLKSEISTSSSEESTFMKNVCKMDFKDVFIDWHLHNGSPNKKLSEQEPFVMIAVDNKLE